MTLGRMTQAVLAFVLLVLGTLIYVFFRKNVWFLCAMGVEHGRYALPLTADNALRYFVLYCLPDGLWFASLLLFLGLFSPHTSKLVQVVAVILPFSMEALQYKSLIPGTCDLWDIITYLFTLICYYLCQRKHFVL